MQPFRFLFVWVLFFRSDFLRWDNKGRFSPAGGISTRLGSVTTHESGHQECLLRPLAPCCWGRWRGNLSPDALVSYRNIRPCFLARDQRAAALGTAGISYPC